MGSTVIVLAGARTVWRPNATLGAAVRVGEALADFGAQRRHTAMTYIATASHDTLRRRAAILASIREFFAERGVLEVETPALSSAGVTDPALENISALVKSLGARPQYLHTSPEFAMKRLLAAGCGDIYQICRVFRDDELGRWHQPEFTLLEWYRIGWDEQRLMTEVEALLATALAVDGHSGPQRSIRVRYSDAIGSALGVGADAPTAEIAARLVGRRHRRAARSRPTTPCSISPSPPSCSAASTRLRSCSSTTIPPARLRSRA